MKHFTIILSLLLCLVLSGCGSFVGILPGDAPLVEDGTVAVEETDVPTDDSFTETSVFSFLGWDALGESYYSDTPVALSLQYNTTDGNGCISPVFDRTSIIAACDALRSMTVTGEAEPAEMEQERVYTLTMADGTEYAFTFDNWCLTSNGTSYTVTGGDELWSISFPAYNNDFDVFDLYFDDAVRAFADNFYTSTPVSVGTRTNSGATLTSDDPAVVAAVFGALSGASVNLVENRADQNIDVTQIRDFIFTMADGTSYTFSFAQQCLAVAACADYGTVYYWLGNISDLWSIDVVPDSEETAFTGGALTGLRDDIQRAAEVAANPTEELTVIGVYVSYSIDGQEGYLTLQDQTAIDFTTQVASVNAEDETVDAPEGSSLTVSVTLSDGSGPIFYFTGDAVQEVIGTYYRCDATDMANLRNTILNLAAQGNDDAEVMD